MCYNIIKDNGEIVSRTTVQPIPSLDLQKDETQDRLKEFDTRLRERLDDRNFVLQDGIGNQFFMEDIQDDGDDNLELETVDEPLPEEDELEYTPDTYDPYVGAEILMPHGNQEIRARVMKRARDNEGNPIG